MFFSTAAVLTLAIAFSATVGDARPISHLPSHGDAVLQGKSGANVIPCRFVLGMKLDEDIFGLNLVEEFRYVLDHIFNQSKPVGAVVTTHAPYEIAKLDGNIWNLTWLATVHDSKTSDNAAIHAMKGLVGLTVNTSATTWTVQSAHCDPPIASATTNNAEGLWSVIGNGILSFFHGQPIRMEDRRKENRTECQLTLRPDSKEAVIGVDLLAQTRYVLARGALMNDPFYSKISVASPHVLTQNRDGTWSIRQYINVLAQDGQQLGPEAIIKASEHAAGSRVKAAHGLVGWTVEAVTCKIVS